MAWRSVFGFAYGATANRSRILRLLSAFSSFAAARWRFPTDLADAESTARRPSASANRDPRLSAYRGRR